MNEAADEPKGLPERYRYLLPAMLLCEPDELILEHRRARWLARLSEDERGLLADAYGQIVARGDGEDLATEVQGKEPKETKRGMWARIFRVIIVLQDLEKEDSRFAGAAETFTGRRRAADWSGLPTDLAYLVEPAERLGHVWTDEAVERLAEEAGGEERELLARVAERIRLNGDWDRIVAWSAENAKRYPEASRRVYGLLGVIDELDL